MAHATRQRIAPEEAVLEVLPSAIKRSTETLAPELSRVLKKIGYDIIRATGELASHRPGLQHPPLLPVKSTYSPWLSDSEYQKTYARVSGHTLVDNLRCYELWSLVAQSAKLQPGALIEIGVWRGGTGCLIAQAAKQAHISEAVYLCDTFEGVVKAGAMDTVYSGGEHRDTSEGIVAALSNSMGLDSIRILKGIFPEDTASLVTNSAFRFAHVDVDVYQSAKDVMKWIWPRLVEGGIVVFDDYGTYGCEGVTQLVNELLPIRDNLFIHNSNGHAILIKRTS